jgi:hypothetical protein
VRYIIGPKAEPWSAIDHVFFPQAIADRHMTRGVGTASVCHPRGRFGGFHHSSSAAKRNF